MNTVIGLEAITREDVEIAGGKGANLGELIREGFPVPPGFVVTASAYQQFVDAISDETPCPPADMRALILESLLPDTLQAAIFKHHQQMQSKFNRTFVYAVRSSATAEDLADASFAGQHDTYYYVTEENLSEMVRKCWASLWSDAACSYRDSQGINHHTVSMAVVVQVMIESEVSGITFTANPVSGNQNEIVTEASWGMGAAIVDGRVSPDQYIFDRSEQSLASKKIADKKFMVPPTLEEDHSRLSPVPESQRRLETLSNEQLNTINEWAEKSERYFGKPQDLEWSIEADEFYILQSRPITTLAEKDDMIPEGEYVLFKPMAENFTDPLLPLSQDIFIRLFPVLTMIRGRAYLNIRDLRPLLPFNMSSTQIAEWAYLSDASNFKPKISILKSIGLSAILYVNYLIIGVFYLRTDNLPDDFMSSFRGAWRKVVNDDTVDAPGLMEKLFFRHRFFEPAGNMPLLVNLSAPRYIVLMGILAKLLKSWLPDLREDAASYLTSGTEGILSTNMGRHIWQLSQVARQSPEVTQIILANEPKHTLPCLQDTAAAAPFVRELNEFLSIHGHRTLKEFELNSVRWEEDPTPVIAMIRNYLQSDVDPTATEAKVEAERIDFEKQIRAGLSSRFLESTFGWRWQLIEYLRRKAKYFIRLRENSRFYHIMVFYGVRLKIQKSGRNCLEAAN